MHRPGPSVEVASLRPWKRLLCVYRRNARRICHQCVAMPNENARLTPKSRHIRSFRRDLEAANSRSARKVLRRRNGFRGVTKRLPSQRRESRQSLPLWLRQASGCERPGKFSGPPSGGNGHVSTLPRSVARRAFRQRRQSRDRCPNRLFAPIGHNSPRRHPALTSRTCGEASVVFLLPDPPGRSK